jgi:hypothetical protein
MTYCKKESSGECRAKLYSRTNMTTRRTLLLAAFAPNSQIVYKGYPKPFLYPILAPDGTVLSRGWPINPRPGDKEDHTWHRGIWWGHGDINGHDFWREQKGTASIRVDKVTSSNELHQTLVTANGEELAKLITRYEFHTEADAYRIDATLKLQSNQPLRFGDTDDGGFAFRLREEFREDRGATLLNSEGQTGAKQIWGKPASWTDSSTTIDNKQYGVAILSHPTNLRHPSGWHARNYGLNSANPFAASSFADEKNGQRGAYTLPANQPLTLKYRVFIHNGDATKAKIAERYSQYAKEPKP